MKKLAYLASLLGFATFFFAGSVAANAPALQVAPLSYTGNLKPGIVESGYVDVANPSDESIQVTSSVQGFRQIDTRGDLSFYDSASLSQAISISLPSFALGPREAIRVGFTIDPSKLPHGGVYGAIFFRTVPSAQNSSSSFILQSANVGTLLILNNGHAPPPPSSVSLKMGLFQFGNGLSGTASFKNLSSTVTGVGVRPALRTKVTPWGTNIPFNSGLVLPAVTRDFAFNTTGSYFGILPVTVSDPVTGANSTAWVFALTGLYRLIAPLVIVLLVLLWLFIKPRLRRQPSAPLEKKPMDGLSRRTPAQPAPVEPPVESKLEELEAADLAKDSGLEAPAAEEKPEQQSVPVKKRKPKATAKKPKPAKRKPKKDTK
ncbi:MAG TPA: hypothetical protein VGR89_11035 [Puia sp.]|nr:hypothetical protein [Puia sp.]